MSRGYTVAAARAGEELGIDPPRERGPTDLSGFDSGQFISGIQRSDVQLDVFGGSSGYRCIHADPPWQFSLYSEKGMSRSPDQVIEKKFGNRTNYAERHYATMPLEQIKALPVGAIAARDCVLFMWCTDPMLPQAIDVGRAWGFTYKTVAFYWAKLRREGSTRDLLHDEPAHKLFPMGTGYWTRANPEMCLLFTRGNPERKSGATAVRKLIVAPRREHSRKPDEARASIERLVHGPYLELFARKAADGWDAWGNQTERFEKGSAA
jgi:N6-adenosine-specific RNA methylase IME4